MEPTFAQLIAALQQEHRDMLFSIRDRLIRLRRETQNNMRQSVQIKLIAELQAIVRSA